MSNSPSVKQVMLTPGKFPLLSLNTVMFDALQSMSHYRLGIICVVDTKQRLKGVFTDGDLRRLLLKEQKPLPFLMTDNLSRHMSLKAKTVSPETSIADAIKKMEQFQVWDLPVAEADDIVCGLLHLHPVVNYLLEGSP